MRCPFCTVAMHPVPAAIRGRSAMFCNDAKGGHYSVEAVACPERRGIFRTHADMTITDGPELGTATSSTSRVFVLWPRVSTRVPIPPEVPEQCASLARETAFILADSPRASAALSRRCLQQLLRNEGKAPPSDLYHEIEWALVNADLPSRAKRSLHSLREIGNMATHPNKGPESDDYLEVEPGEADWTLDVLDDLFDHYFVGPAIERTRATDLAKKLGRAPQA